MDRLTRRMCGGWGVEEGCELNTLQGMRAVVERLAAYENTGLTPDEIIAIVRDRDAEDKSPKCGQWISVDDRLPEKDGEYLVSIHQEDDEIGLAGDLVIPAWYQTCPLLFVPKSIGWHLLNEFYEFSDRMRDDITHWMPMPEPPKFDEEE